MNVVESVVAGRQIRHQIENAARLVRIDIGAADHRQCRRLVRYLPGEVAHQTITRRVAGSHCEYSLDRITAPTIARHQYVPARRLLEEQRKLRHVDDVELHLDPYLGE